MIGDRKCRRWELIILRDNKVTAFSKIKNQDLKLEMNMVLTDQAREKYK